MKFIAFAKFEIFGVEFGEEAFFTVLQSSFKHNYIDKIWASKIKLFELSLTFRKCFVKRVLKFKKIIAKMEVLLKSLNKGIFVT